MTDLFLIFATGYGCLRTQCATCFIASLFFAILVCICTIYEGELCLREIGRADEARSRGVERVLIVAAATNGTHVTLQNKRKINNTADTSHNLIIHLGKVLILGV